jgi:hypothetical protein
MRLIAPLANQCSNTPGQVFVQVVFLCDGSVGEVRIVSGDTQRRTTVSDPDVLQCVLDLVRDKARVPPFGRDTFNVIFPYRVGSPAP